VSLHPARSPMPFVILLLVASRSGPATPVWSVAVCNPAVLAITFVAMRIEGIILQRAFHSGLSHRPSDVSLSEHDRGRKDIRQLESGLRSL